MKVAIVVRTELEEKDKPFDLRYIIDGPYREISGKLGFILIPIVSIDDVKEIEQICDALIVPGCQANIHPKYYNDSPIKGQEYIIDDYKLDRVAIEAFYKNHKPILGICGGIQSINVFFGGDLNQKIPNHHLMDGTMHSIKIDKDSFLYRVYNKEQIEVNSYHRQSVRKVASGFKVVAKSQDGIIEAIEKENIFAVQWHPEILLELKIFKEFLKNIRN